MNEKCRNVKNKMITRRNVTKKHDESLSFDYPMYIYTKSAVTWRTAVHALT